MTVAKLPPVDSYIERVPLDQTFAGKGDNPLDRFKQLRRDGWDLEVLIEYEPSARGRPKTTGYVIALGCRPREES